MTVVHSTAATITSVILEAPDRAATESFYTSAFGLGATVAVRSSQAPTSGFRGFTLSLVVSQPSIVDSLIGTALDGGATTLKPPSKSFWGYGGVVQAPDGAIWKVATSSNNSRSSSRADKRMSGSSSTTSARPNGLPSRTTSPLLQPVHGATNNNHAKASACGQEDVRQRTGVSRVPVRKWRKSAVSGVWHG